MNSIWLNPLVSLVCSALLFFLLKNAVPSYFSKKGGNLATKQDIGDITKEVEKAKDEFTKGLEQLKVELQYSNSLRIAIRNESRAAIVNCYEACSLWINSLADTRFGDINEQNEGDSDNILSLFNSLYLSLLATESKMELYIGIGDYTEKLSDIKSKGLKLRQFIGRSYLDYGLITKKYLIKRTVALAESQEAAFELLKLYGKEKGDFQQAFGEEFLALYTDVFTPLAEWRPMLLELITNLKD